MTEIKTPGEAPDLSILASPNDLTHEDALQLVEILRGEDRSALSTLAAYGNPYRLLLNIVEKAGLTAADISKEMEDVKCPGQITRDLADFDTLSGSKLVAYAVIALNDEFLIQAMCQIISIHDALNHAGAGKFHGPLN